MNYGFINDREADPNAYVFGSGELQGEVLTPDGQWEAWLPSDEFQNLHGVEPYACATFGTFNAIETILRKRFTQVENFSDRYTAKLTETDIKRGNSPHYVVEYIRKNGGVYESDWPFTSDINTFEKYYAPVPNIEDRLLPQFTVGHDYVSTNPEAMKDALRYSPLGISVYGWQFDDQGLAYRPEGQRDNHWCMVYGYEDGKYWKVFDSYDNSKKKLRWNHKAEMIKRYTITRTAESQGQLGWWAFLLKIAEDWMKQRLSQTEPPVKRHETPITATSTPQTTPPTTQPKKDLLRQFCLAIQAHEGYFPGSRAYRNNNPGNIKYGTFAQSCGATGKDDKNFAKFSSYDVGFAALTLLVTRAATGKSTIYSPNMTIVDFFRKYAPSSDHNDPDGYAKNVAKRLGVEASTFRIKNLIS